MEKLKIEIEWEDNKNFDVDKVISAGWEELAKCERVDVVDKHSRKVYAN